ncbi:hypothetical protein [Desulfonema magnum]|uniref:Uncharacterized protein n=1 Tax=Desulfonema magnum TaxID=45655 RepID=A0A975BHM6_9BACT|nr:hypothetical protein [Desulfonema magnum]QTA85463.1 Uncharacterized protein dnm_014740 [Desulfonema magnum]
MYKKIFDQVLILLNGNEIRCGNEVNELNETKRTRSVFSAFPRKAWERE